MDCAAVRRVLLAESTVEIEAILAAGAGGEQETAVELERHLGRCRECRRLAMEIVAQTAALARGLEELGPRTPVERAFVEAIGEGDRRRRRRAQVRVFSGLVAAGVAALLLARTVLVGPDGPKRGQVPEAGAGAAVAVAAPPAVEAGEGLSVAVFHTDDPNVVVFWFFQGGERDAARQW